MKKLLAVFLTACLIFALAGCAGKDNGVNSTTQNTQAKSKENKSNKVLVAYFSATGNTESAAKIIADNTNADVFEITPKNEYTDEDLDWTNDESRVSVEHNNPDKRNVELVTITPEKFDDYDTVFIGYPIWWGIAAWPIDSFVKGNDFSGKTVIPFCTSASSGIEDSGDLLKQVAGTGKWLNGKRFSENPSSDEIISWLDSINY